MFFLKLSKIEPPIDPFLKMVGYNNLTSDTDFESLVSSSFSAKGLILPYVICFVVNGFILGISYEFVSI